MSTDATSAAALFDPIRLRLARQLAGISRAELARRAGLSAAAISQFESGAARPKSASLARIALALAVPVGVFAGTGEPALLPSVSESFFRSLRRTSQRDRERAAAHAGVVAELVRRIEKSVVLPTYQQAPELALDPSDEAEAAENAAAQLRKQWAIPDGPLEHVVRVLERHGVIVVRSSLLTADVDAFSWAGGGRPIVLLGSDKGVYERSRLDAAHELAHVVLHAADPEPANRRLERQAHRFAGALLVPAEEFIEEWPKGQIDWSGLQQMRQRWGVSMAALLFRAKELGSMSETAYTNAMKYMSRKGWRVHEPGPRRKPEEPALLSEALGLLAQNGTDLAQLAEEAHLMPASELAKRFRLRPRSPLAVSV